MGRCFLGAGSLLGAWGNSHQAWMPEKQLCAAPSLTKNQGRRKAALLASKRISSPGMLCGQCTPLLSGGSQPQHCSANICHLSAGCFPVHSMSPLADPESPHMAPASGSGHPSLCPSLPRDPESSATSPHVVLSHLFTAAGHGPILGLNRPKTKGNCPE